jgi:hypothetical protein
MNITNYSIPAALWAIFAVAFFIFSWWRAAQVVNRSVKPGGNMYKTKFQFVGIGIRAVFFDDEEEYFRLWDIIVIAIGSVGIALAFLYLLAKGGALEFLPFLRKIFGVKLFRIRRKKVIVDGTKTP